MIDPIHSLAFAVQANPGVYAVLIGSGVSRSASIPTLFCAPTLSPVLALKTSVNTVAAEGADISSSRTVYWVQVTCGLVKVTLVVDKVSMEKLFGIFV